MEKVVSYIDIAFKIVLAATAAWSAYLFGYQRQQNDDVKIVTELLSDASHQKQLIGIGLAKAYEAQGRIPGTVFTDLLLALRDQATPTQQTRANLSSNDIAPTSIQQAAGAALSKVASTSSTVQVQLDQANSALPIRIYFQTGNENDKGRADHFGDKIERLPVDPAFGRALTIPPTEIVASYNGPTELRCFRTTECTQIAPRLIALLKAQGANTLADQPTNLSRQYESSGRIRPMHFEVWFARGAVP